MPDFESQAMVQPSSFQVFMSGVALAGPPISGATDVPVQLQRKENSLHFKEISANSFPPQQKRHQTKKGNSIVRSRQTADLPLPKRVSGDRLMIDNSKSPVQSDVLLENPRKKKVTGAYKLSANSSSVEMDVEQTVASTSNLMNPIVEIDSSSDFEMDEEIRPLIEEVNYSKLWFPQFD